MAESSPKLFQIDIKYADGTAEHYGTGEAGAPEAVPSWAPGQPAPGSGNGGLPTDQPSPVTPNGGGSNTSDTESTKSGFKQSVAALRGHVISGAKTSVNWVISNYGMLAQDSVAQAKIDANMRIIGYGQTIGYSTAAGGWVGALVAIGGIALNETLDAFNVGINMRRERQHQEEIYKRLGGVRTGGGRN